MGTSSVSVAVNLSAYTCIINNVRKTKINLHFRFSFFLYFCTQKIHVYFCGVTLWGHHLELSDFLYTSKRSEFYFVR